MECKPLAETVFRMDAVSEFIRMPCFYLSGQRVSGDGLHSMSLTVNGKITSYTIAPPIIE